VLKLCGINVLRVRRGVGTYNIYRHKKPERNANQEMRMKIYAGNLSYNTTDEDLKTAFGQFGKVDSAEVVKDKIDGRSKGFGFVEMPSNEEAMTAIKEMDGQDLNGRALRVNESKPRPEGDRGGFRSGGRGGFGGGNRSGGFGGGSRSGGFGGGGRGGRGGDR
jgi:RNA recognition motif-containing protein